MPASITVARYARPRVDTCDAVAEELDEDLLVYDLRGEWSEVPLLDRLKALALQNHPRVVVLRGFLESPLYSSFTAEDETYRVAFPGARVVYALRFDPLPTLHALHGNPEAADAGRLLPACAEFELAAHLAWAEAIWRSPEYHFTILSGEHTDAFVRMSDAISDPHTLARFADWCLPRVPHPVLLVADTAGLMPLLQEVKLRLLGAGSDACRLLVLPLYALSDEEALDQLEAYLPWCRDQQAAVQVVLSVSATGSFLSRFDRLVRIAGAPHVADSLVLCSVGQERYPGALTHVPTRRYENGKSCDLCRGEASAPLHVDSRRLTTRVLVDSVVAKLPPAKELGEGALLVHCADAVGALRVHVDRPDAGRHLSVYIDTPQLLTSRGFRAAATLALARTLRGFEVDLALIPEHSASSALQQWLHEEGVENAAMLPRHGPLDGNLRERMRTARRILVFDDCVITSRTLRGAIEAVQRARDESDDFRMKALVLVGRPELPSTWKGLRDRFYIRLEHNLETAWPINLPEELAHGECPWCAEHRWLEQRLALAPSDVRPYVEQRLQRLSGGEGLAERIYLGSELGGDGDRAGQHTTPGSYFGNLSDVGAFVMASALLQRMRNEWRQGRDYLTRKLVLPLPTILERFTDPVLPSALLRAARRSELVTPAIADELGSVLRSIAHDRQHPVLLAELSYAWQRRRLPSAVRLEELAECPAPAHSASLLTWLQAVSD